MSERTNFGRLEPVELRDHWPVEASDFTPWLASDETISLLSEAIGIDLEVEETEAHVGPFRADILCRDTSADRPVLIENQLERTDHTHLGQLLTYAAGLDAAAIIWVARKFTEEHRQALDWLNEITAEDFHFFGVEIELWQIAGSLPALRLNVVARPNDWQKAVRGVGQRSRSSRAVTYLDVWSGLVTNLQSKDLPIRLPNASGMNQLRFELPDGRLVLGYSLKNRAMSVYALIRGDERASPYEELRQRESQLAEAIRLPLHWVDDKDSDYGYGNCVFDYDHEDATSVTQGAEAVARAITSLYEVFWEHAERSSVGNDGV